MAAAKEGDQNFANYVIVADNDLLHLRFETLENLLKLLRLHHTPFPINE